MKTSAAAGTAMTLAAATYSRAAGSNDRIGVAFVGVGGRCQAHLAVINKLAKENKGAAPVAVCDVWDGHEAKYTWWRRQGKRPTRRACTRRRRRSAWTPTIRSTWSRITAASSTLKEADVVFIGTPDHWHAKISIDAAAAGKDVYCEKPMTKTIDEAIAVADAMRKHNRVMTVGVRQWPSRAGVKPTNSSAPARSATSRRAQTSLLPQLLDGPVAVLPPVPGNEPENGGLGHVPGPQLPGPSTTARRSAPARRRCRSTGRCSPKWRCYWPFGGGMFTDLFVHQTTHMIAAMGVRFPARVVGGGGLYLEYDGRDVPDVSAIVADYDEGCQLLVTATMINEYPIEEVIRGKLATVRFSKRDGQMGYEILPEKVSGGPGRPKNLTEQKADLHATFLRPRHDAGNCGPTSSSALRSRSRETMCTPDLGAAAFSTVAMGVKSYREGKALFWDKEQRKPVEADPSWASRWEARSKQHGKPNQIKGWQGDDAGSTVTPEPYQKLAGPWVNGKDPAEGGTAAGG